MRFRSLLLLGVVVACGCEGEQRPSPTSAIRNQPAEFEPADVSVLYIGNSHTGMHDIPGLVGRMIQSRHPQKSYFQKHISVGFLEDAGKRLDVIELIKKHPWKFVVLQAQKISMSGKFRYSQKEGIELATAAKERGATVYFFSEWGRRDVKNDGVVQESIYQQMAEAAGVSVAPIGRAWDVALVAKPTLSLYEPDGNHESATGAFLTACVFYALLTDSDPLDLANYDYPTASKGDRLVMARAASTVWKQEQAKKSKALKDLR